MVTHKLRRGRFKRCTTDEAFSQQLGAQRRSLKKERYSVPYTAALLEQYASCNRVSSTVEGYGLSE